MTVEKRNLAKLFDFSSIDVPKEIVADSVILGFGALDLSYLHEETITINTIFLPIKDGRWQWDSSFSLPVDIRNLSFLSERMTIKQGVLFGRQVKNEHAVKVAFPKQGRRLAVRGRELFSQIKWLPSDFMHVYKDFSGSWFCHFKATNLTTGKPINLYVSCAEVLRFYYPHNRLIEAAVSAEYADVTVYNSDIEKNKGDRPFVQLRKRIPDICAPHAARIRHSSYAKSVFERIYTDSVHGKVDEYTQQHYLKAFPPISEDCEWLIEATKINAEGDLLASGIKQCNATFPFNELLFGRDNDGRYTGLKRHRDPNFIAIPQGVLDNEEGNISVAENGLKTLNIETLNIIFDYEDDAPSFGDLQDMSVKKIEKVITQQLDIQNIRVYTNQEAIDAIVSSGLGQKGNGERFAKADISTGTVKKSQTPRNEEHTRFFDAFTEFQDAVISLSSDYSINWENVSFFGRRHEAFYLNALTPKELHELDISWLYLSKSAFNKAQSYNEKLIHTRKFVVAQIEKNNRFIYLADFEKKTRNKINSDSSSILCFYHVAATPLLRSTIKQTILDFAQSKSGWKKRCENVKRDVFKHSKKLSESLSGRVDKIFKDMDQSI